MKQDDNNKFVPTKDLGIIAVCVVLLLVMLWNRQWLPAGFVLIMTAFFIHKWVKLVKNINNHMIKVVNAVCTDIRSAGFGSFTTSKLCEFEDSDSDYRSFTLYLANKSFGKSVVKRGYKYSMMFVDDGNEYSNSNFVDLKRF